MRRTTFSAIAALALLVSLFPAAGATAEEGTHSDNISHVKNLGYELKYGQTKSYGTDIEFAELTVGGEEREYAFAGSYDNGLQIVDITDPENAFIASVYDCGVLQGDVQIFRQEDRTYATYTLEDTSSVKVQSECVRELTDATAQNKAPAYGTFIIDVTNPLDPVGVGHISVPEGSHNGTVHPSGLYFYNSNSSLYNATVEDGVFPGIEVYDISDVTAPKRITKLQLPFVPASLGTESHDITFDTDGDRAYSAALSQGVIIDTSDPAAPKIISTIVDPTINVWHQADPVTLTAEDGSKRTFLIAEDEYAGAAGGPHCPSGGVHIYDITGTLEQRPQKVGYWNIDDMRLTSPTGRCTAHVFDIHEDEGIMTMAFYNGGIRVVDLNGLAGIGLGDNTTVVGDPMQELAHYYFPNSDTWSVKTPKIHPVSGDMYLYGNDVSRGLDIYKYEGTGQPPGKARKAAAESGGTWMTPAEAELALPRLSPAVAYNPFCLLPQ